MRDSIKKLFAEHFISAGPRGSIAQGRDEFAKWAGKAVEFYRSVGWTSAKILSMDETEISREYSMVKPLFKDVKVI